MGWNLVQDMVQCDTKSNTDDKPGTTPGIQLSAFGRCAHLGGIMVGGLLFVVSVVLRFHYHDPIPWYIWALALVAMCVSFGEPAMRSAVSKKD